MASQLYHSKSDIWGFFLVSVMYMFYRIGVTGSTLNAFLFSNWLRAVFGAVKGTAAILWCVMDSENEEIKTRKI